jgi:hypothetical protein
MEFLQQLDGLVGTDFVVFAGHRVGRHQLQCERATDDGKREKLLPVYPSAALPASEPRRLRKAYGQPGTLPARHAMRASVWSMADNGLRAG